MNRRAFLIRSSTSLAGAARCLPGAQSSGSVRVGDSRIEISIEYGSAGIRERAFRVGHNLLGNLQATPWELELEEGRISALETEARLIAHEHTSALSYAIFEGEAKNIRWRLEYRLRGPARVTKRLAFSSATNRRLIRAICWRAESSIEPKVARTKIQDIAAFYRSQDQGLFVSLDFPYSKIDHSRNTTVVWYPPHHQLNSGTEYECHSLTLGAVRLEQINAFGFDEGEVAAFNNYLQEHVRPRFQRPLYIFASIVNRYTQVEGDTVFYTMRDQPSLSFNTELVERDLSLMQKLGMEYYQVFPGAFEWAPHDPRSNVDRLVTVARQKGLRMGDYSATSVLASPHFNVARFKLERHDWELRSGDARLDGKIYCFGNPEFVDYYVRTVVSNCRRYGFELHCLDFLKLAPCQTGNHGHPPGNESLYHQVRGVLQVISALNAISPEMLVWPNSGDWVELLPKLAWYSPNLYLTDPFIATPWQGLNMTRLLDDARREQMVTLRNSVFIPYRFFTNCQYFFSQNSIVPDLRNFEYGALSTLAVTPNLCLGEFRSWLTRLPQHEQDRVSAFYQRWTKLVRDNYSIWTKTYQAGDLPGMGSIEIYAHAARDRGFVFLVNPNYWDRTVNVPLNETLGFPNGGRCEIRELYPSERRLLTAVGPWPNFGTVLPFRVPAQQVTVLEVKPAPSLVESATLYGIAGTIEDVPLGYRIKVRGHQGRNERFALILPPGTPVVSSAAVLNDANQPDPRLESRTKIELLSIGAEGALIEITFRRMPAPAGIRSWRALAGTLAQGLSAKWYAGLPSGANSFVFPLFLNAGVPLPITDDFARRSGFGPIANFCGAYIENAFGEPQETWIELECNAAPAHSFAELVSRDESPAVEPMLDIAYDDSQAWWFESSFQLPFIYQIGAEPPFSEHVFAVFPLCRQHEAKQLKAWINEIELNVQCYAYPRNRKLGCYYADLVGSGARAGENRFVVHVEY